MADISKTLKDTAYVAVGLGVIAFQKAQVRRVELQKQVRAQLHDTRDAGHQAGRRGHRSASSPCSTSVEERLPAQAKTIVKQARETAKDARGQVREIVGKVIPAAA